MKHFGWGIILLGLFLVGCVSQPTHWIPVQNPALAWNNHQNELKQIHDFTVEGKAGISDGKTGQTFSFNWVQHSTYYQIDFYGPLGVKIASLLKNKDGVFLDTQSGKLSASNPETLMQEELGFSLPIQGLQDWIIGLPQHETSEKQLNPYGYLMNLKEDGWEISYLDYERYQGLGVPHKMILKNGQYRVVLLISFYV